MRDIAREMGIEAASLYNHISSKQLILKELLLQIATLFTVGMKEVTESDNSPILKLEALIKLHVQLTVDHTNAISLIPNEWIHLKEPYIKDFLQLRDTYEKDFRAIIKTCIQDNHLTASDPDLALFSILSTLRWLYSWYSKHKDIDVEVLKKELIKNLIYGLK